MDLESFGSLLASAAAGDPVRNDTVENEHTWDELNDFSGYQEFINKVSNSAHRHPK